MLKLLKAYTGAVGGAYLTGSIFASLVILGNVRNMGMDVTAAVALKAIGHDLLGLTSSYLPLIAVAFLIALLFTHALLKILPSHPQLLYVLAGAVALVALHMTMKAVLGLSGIAATRTLAGLMSQGVAGAFGGWLYYRLYFKAIAA